LCVSASDYDALAARVQELERERDELKKKAYRYAHWTPEHTIEEWLADRQRIVEAKQVEADAALRQQLAEAQGRVTEVGELNVKLRDAEQQVARLREFAEFIKDKRRKQWHRWADEADDPAPTDNEIETFDEQFREACKALRETGV
jgi:chromosome segregation ATPase